MYSIYTKQLEVGCAQQSDAEILSYLSSVLRSLLQTLALTSLEIALQATPVLDDELDLRQFLDRFTQPSDGLPVEILDALVPSIRSLVFRGYMKGWFERTESAGDPLVGALTEWVEFRNKRPAHGVIDAPTTTSWARQTQEILKRLLSTFPDALPKLDRSELNAHVGDLVVPIKTPLVIDGHAIVISKVLSRRGVWKMQGQLLSWETARDVTIDLNSANIFASDDHVGEKFRWTEVPCEPKSKLVLNSVPVRQTSTFVGRKKELERLKEWINELDDVRTCLVYGDGGFGKTTLVLEFFNSLLEGTIDDVPALPSVIGFYTAKKTKWTEEGLVHFKGISDAMEDSVRELMYCFTPVLGKEWYKVEGIALIDRVATQFSGEGFTRDDVLLIIDNAETLATSQADAEVLGDFISRVAKRIGRVVITSRRRELLAAVPISVSQLSEKEAVSLIQRLGKEYEATAINQAGEARLRIACEKLMLKPLLIDTLVRYVARSSSGIQEGLDQILKKTSDELLEFLYEDAWARMNSQVQEVFMVLVSLASPIDGKCVGDVCTEVGVLHAEFQASLTETYFASIVDHGDSYDLEVVPLAKEFFQQKKRRLLKSAITQIDKIAFKVDKLAAARYEIDKNYRQDRVADAFRSEYAKAAKIATIKKDFGAATEFFELAVLEEPLNAALKERFASFLFRTIGDAHAALPHAESASVLDPRSGDAWLTLGLIRYKLGDLPLGDEALDKARQFGKPESLCFLRKAIARYHHAAREPYSRRSLKLLKEADALVDRSMRSAIPGDMYFGKNRAEAEKYQALIRSLVLRIHRREVSAENAPTGE